MEQREKYESQMIHLDKKGHNKVTIELQKLEDMATYVNQELIEIPEERKQKLTRDKFAEIIGFISG